MSYWLVVDYIMSGLGGGREYYGPFPTKRIAKKAGRKREHKSITSAYVERCEDEA